MGKITKRKKRNFQGTTLMGRPIFFLVGGSGPGPHNIFREWAATRPSPSFYFEFPAGPSQACQLFQGFTL